MPWWLSYAPCDQCLCDGCETCQHLDRPLSLRAIESEIRPPRTVDGPCADAQCLLLLIQDHFEFDPGDGLMRLKDRGSLE